MAPGEKHRVTKGKLSQWDHQPHRGNVQGSTHIWQLHSFIFLPAGEGFPFLFPLSFFPFLTFPEINFHFWSQSMSSATAHNHCASHPASTSFLQQDFEVVPLALTGMREPWIQDIVEKRRLRSKQEKRRLFRVLSLCFCIEGSNFYFRI